MSRIPIRLRMTLAFALVSAVVLAALGYFVYARFDSELSEQIDQSLRTHGDDIASLVAGGDLAQNAKLLGREESFAQVLTPEGRIYATTPQLGADPQITPAESARAVQASVPGHPATCPQPHGSGPAPGAACAGLPRRDLRRGHGRVARRSQRVAGQPEDAPLHWDPGGAASCFGGGLRGLGAGAAAGRGDAPAGRGDLGRRARGKAATTRGRRRNPQAGGDAEPDARPTRGGNRARASLRRRRQPRAPDPFGNAQDRARTGASLREDAGRDARGDLLGDRRGRPADPARRGPARPSPLGRGKAGAATCAGSGSPGSSGTCASATRPGSPRRAAPW